MGDRLEGIESYVPARLVRQVAANLPQPDGPLADRFTGTVLLADICGFTLLAESLAHRGDAGVEELTRCLNVYFGRLIDLIVEHGGDILEFAGDALLAIWYADVESLEATACRAAQCALAAQERLNDCPVAEDVRLSLRIGISAGPLAILHVGGLDGRRELVATGDPFVAVGGAKTQARPGGVAMSADTWELVRDDIDAEPLTAGTVRVRGVRRPLALSRVEGLRATDRRSLLAYVGPAVVDQLGRGESGLVAELRRVTVLFVNFPGLTPSTPLERAHAVMLELQASLSRFEGTINKLSLDEKGASLVAAFGLPPLSHDDDPERGVRAALAIRERLALMNVRHSTGIATGLAFCGIVGNATRREYTMIGDVVNFAARLMQAAQGGILCNSATTEAGRANLGFEPLGSIHVKGKAGDLPVYRPAHAAQAPRERHAEFADKTLGRVAEQQALDDACRGLAERGEGALIVFEGMAGIGKSRLIEEAKRRARKSGLTCLESGGDAMEKSTAFYVWRSIFDRAFDLDRATGMEERRERVAARIAACGRPEWTALLPLVNPVLRTAFPQTDATATIDERARASVTYDFLTDLLVALSRDAARHVVLFERAQWIDSASVALASRICARQEPLVIVAAMRPIPGTAAEEIERLAAATPRARRFTLEPLGGDETVEIAGRALGVAARARGARRQSCARRPKAIRC